MLVFKEDTWYISSHSCNVTLSQVLFPHVSPTALESEKGTECMGGVSYIKNIEPHLAKVWLYEVPVSPGLIWQ